MIESTHVARIPVVAHIALSPKRGSGAAQNQNPSPTRAGTSIQSQGPESDRRPMRLTRNTTRQPIAAALMNIGRVKDTPVARLRTNHGPIHDQPAVFSSGTFGIRAQERIMSESRRAAAAGTSQST